MKKLKVIFVGSYTIWSSEKGQETFLKYVVLGTEKELDLYRKHKGVSLREYENTEDATDSYNGKPMYIVRAIKEIEF
jgi:nitrate reductase alpha subunit